MIRRQFLATVAAGARLTAVAPSELPRVGAALEHFLAVSEAWAANGHEPAMPSIRHPDYLAWERRNNSILAEWSDARRALIEAMEAETPLLVDSYGGRGPLPIWHRARIENRLILVACDQSDYGDGFPTAAGNCDVIIVDLDAA